MRRRGWVAVSCVVLLWGCGGGDLPDETVAKQAPVTPGPVPDRLDIAEPSLTDAAPTTTVAVPAPTTVVPEVTTTTAPPPPPPPDPAQILAADLAVYRGLGTWIDVYDWSIAFGKDGPLVEPADIDRMADVGVQTLYVQTSKWEAQTDVLEPERLLPLIERARARGMRVVAWYLPTLEDPATDIRRILAAASLPVDGIAVDIEAKKVEPAEERTRRLLEVSNAVRQALPGRAIGAIPFPPVVMEVINPSFWPGFPWQELAGIYDIWLPMNYQSFRKSGTEYRDAYRYTAENIDRMRANLGRPDALVHTIGGIADATTPEDVDAMLRASVERGVVGGSLYDWRTTGEHLWPALQGFRSR